MIPQLVREDYDIDEKQRTVNLTEAGNEHAEALLRAAGIMKEGSLYEAANATLVHHVNQALRAHKLFQRDKDYIVRNGEVVIVDEFTGRMMPGRRYSEGLHQALEAKEHVHRPARERDARLDHVPELFPPLQEARRHDRHGGDRSRRIRRDLQAHRRRNPDPSPGLAQATRTTRSIAPARRS